MKFLSELELQTPVIAGSNPLCLDGDAMIRLYQGGAGAVVTKNFCLKVEKNPPHYMREYQPGTLINCERYLDYSGDRWLETEIPKATKAGVPVIANIGMNVESVEPYLDRIKESGACAVECVSYRSEWLVPLVAETRKRVDLPLIAKLTPNYPDLTEIAKKCEALGADAFTCGDSKGPVQKIDIETGKPFCGGADGYGWLSGAGLLPFAVHNVIELRKVTDLPIIGMGGVTNWQAAVEMIMAGADAVGVCSALVSYGIPVLSEINAGITRYLESHGYRDLSEIRGMVHRYLKPYDNDTGFGIVIDENKCSRCGRCITSCVYNAISEDEDGRLSVDMEKCSMCGICSGMCPAVSETEL